MTFSNFLPYYDFMYVYNKYYYIPSIIIHVYSPLVESTQQRIPEIYKYVIRTMDTMKISNVLSTIEVPIVIGAVASGEKTLLFDAYYSVSCDDARLDTVHHVLVLNEQYLLLSLLPLSLSFDLPFVSLALY